MRRVKSLTALVGILAIVIAACSGGPGAGDTTTSSPLPGGTSPAPDAQLVSAALVQLDSCDAFLDYVISHALELVGPYGLDVGGWGWPLGGDTIVEEAAADDGASSVGGGDFSRTNVQVEGVDEPDIVKNDGERIVMISDGTLIVVDVTGDEPTEVGRLRMPDISVQNLFLSGDTVLAFGSSWVSGPMPFVEGDASIGPIQSTPTVILAEVDISGDPEIVRTMEIDGAFISGRMVEDSVRLVSTSSPVGFEWEYPAGSGLRAEREATEKNRAIVRASTIENWIPYYVITDSEGNVEAEGTLFDCDRASHPEEFSGLDMLSVLTVDTSSGLHMEDATGVLATGDTIYASADSLYVATQNWNSWRWLTTGEEADRVDGPTTEIHKFDTSDPNRTEYTASGGVEGYLLNQFAMDEYEGMLRVASTTDPNGWGGGADSESRVTVLRDINGELIPIGLVDGLGATERIYSVRFAGDVAYVVTFRQTDPLYTLDLSDPRSPRAVGELKIPGYSAYLHPIGDGLLIGVGQDATDDGQVQGTQVSLFDVSDISDPVRLDTYTLSEGTNSQVEYDHHAFLFWEDLAVIPVQRYWWDEDKDSIFMGAVALEIDGDELVEAAELVHPGGDSSDWDWRAQIVRSVVIDGSLYTISAKGIMKSPLDALDTGVWLDL